MAMAFEQFIELYDHPILKITVNNKNTYSSVKEIVLRITYDDLKDDQDIKFTLKEKNSWLPCQRNLTDFYILIPNNLQQKTIIYGHIIPNNPDLIEQTEETQLIYNKYNFVELYNHLINNPGIEKKSSQWSDKYGEEYEIQSTIINYNYALDYDKEGNPRLTLQSKLNMSVDDVNNPNYKNYVETSDGSNQTEKGKFPLSSRFRSKQNFEAPDIEKENPKWKTEIISEENLPVFEVRINRRGLSPLITNGVVTNDSLEQFPINIELNYDYLSTSREYHQHYYGLEGENRNRETGALKTENKTINVLEGNKLHTLDSEFNTNNYRIINWGNPYDNRHSMYVNHDEEIPISLANGWKNQNDLWYRNVCYDYYRLVGGKDGITSKKIVNLEKDREYSLCFFMFIPSYTTKNDCSVSVVTVDENNIHKLYDIDSIFLKEFTNEWIYHEIPFIADKTNTVEIVTPPEGESVFFTNIVIKKMPRYTPTLQYTDRGLQVLDTDSEGKLHNTFKSVNEEKDPGMLRFQPDDVEYISTNKTLPTPFTDVIINTELDYDLIYDDISKNLYSIYPNTSENENLHFLKMIKTSSDTNSFVYEYYNFPEPEDKSLKEYPSFDTYQEYKDYYEQYRVTDPDNEDNNYIQVIDATTSKLRIVGENENMDLGFKSNNEIDNNCCLEENTLFGFYSDYIEASYGPGNYISLNFSDEQGNPINDGYVDISIMKNKQQDAEWTDEQYNFKRKYVKNGVAQWNNVDLTYLKPNDNNSTCPQCTFYKDENFSYDSGIYYLKIEYTNECEYSTKKIYKRLRVGASNLSIQAFINEERKCDVPQITSKQIFAEDFPIKISAYVYDQNTGSVYEPVTGDIDNLNIGWCELSINDKKHQSTRMDLTGEFDFYLDTNDINCGEINTIKIEYFTKYNKVSCFTYFELDIDDCAWLKPAVPIVIKYFSQDGFITLPEENTTKVSYPEKEGRIKAYVGPNIDCCYDDYMLQYIETGPHKEYSVTVERYISYDGININVNGEQKNIDQYWIESDYKDAPIENKIYGIDVFNEQKLEDVGDNWGRFVIPDVGVGSINNQNIDFNEEGKYIIKDNNIEIHEKESANSHLIANKENQTIYYYYRVTTDNLQYTGTYKDLYRPYQRVFCIIKHAANDTSVYEYEGEPCRCDERIKITMKESL